MTKHARPLGTFNKRQAVLQMVKALSGRTFDASRWFCEDDELLHVGSKTYAVSNQWGIGTEEVLVRLTTSFPQTQVEIRREEDAP